MLAGGELRQGALAGIVTDAVAAAAGVAGAGGAAGRDARGRPAGRRRGGADRGRGRPRRVPPAGRAARAADAREDRAVARGGARADRPRGASSGSSTACASRCTATATTSAIFTRTLDPVGERMPEIAEAVRALPLRSVILDGEAIALRPDGRPRPFQETASRAASRGDVAALRAAVPLTPFFFDVLHLDGRDLLDLPASERLRGDRAGPARRRLGAAHRHRRRGRGRRRSSADALARGHEGVVVEVAGRAVRGRPPRRGLAQGQAGAHARPRRARGRVGPRTPAGLLSNLHLGARDPEADGFVMLGKTFKGLTDELLAWQTERLLELESRRDRRDRLRPPRSSSSRSRSTASRRARATPAAWRCASRASCATAPTSAPAEADTIATVRMLHEARTG